MGNGLVRQPIVGECRGCPKIETKAGTEYCRVYPNPAYWWKGKVCPIKPQKPESASPSKKKRVGQQKHARAKRISKKTSAALTRIGGHD